MEDHEETIARLREALIQSMGRFTDLAHILRNGHYENASFLEMSAKRIAHVLDGGGYHDGIPFGADGQNANGKTWAEHGKPDAQQVEKA